MNKPKPLLSPRNDVIFKAILSDSDILIDFLSGVTNLTPEDYKEVYIVDPHLHREAGHDKLGILDVKVKTKTGKLIDIEIQLYSHTWLRERMVYYLSKMVTGQVSEGDSYEKIKKTIIILITDFVLNKDSPRCHHRYQLYDIDDGTLFSDVLEINTLELPKAKSGGDIEDDSKLAGWLTFFNMREGNEEELMAVAEKNVKIKKARTILVKLSEDERTRMLAESYQMAEWDAAARLRTAQMEGEERGLQRGRTEGLQEGAAKGRTEGVASVMNLIDAGVPPDEIRRRLGL